MTCNISSRCLPGSEITWSQPCAYSRSLEPCVVTCGDSRAVVYAPPVVLTLPGPTLNSSSQESIVGASFPQPYGAVTSYGSGIGGSSGSGGFSGSGGSFGYGSSSGVGGSYGSGGSFGSGGVSGIGGSFGSGGSFGYGGSSGSGGCYSRRSYSSSCGPRLGNCGFF